MLVWSPSATGCGPRRGLILWWLMGKDPLHQNPGHSKLYFNWDRCGSLDDAGQGELLRAWTRGGEQEKEGSVVKGQTEGVAVWEIQHHHRFCCQDGPGRVERDVKSANTIAAKSLARCLRCCCCCRCCRRLVVKCNRHQHRNKKSEELKRMAALFLSWAFDSRRGTC